MRRHDSERSWCPCLHTHSMPVRIHWSNPCSIMFLLSDARLAPVRDQGRGWLNGEFYGKRHRGATLNPRTGKDWTTPNSRIVGYSSSTSFRSLDSPPLRPTRGLLQPLQHIPKCFPAGVSRDLKTRLPPGANRFQPSPEALYMVLLSPGQRFKPNGDLFEALFACCSGHLRVHVRALLQFSRNRSKNNPAGS